LYVTTTASSSWLHPIKGQPSPCSPPPKFSRLKDPYPMIFSAPQSVFSPFPKHSFPVTSAACLTWTTGSPLRSCLFLNPLLSRFSNQIFSLPFHALRPLSHVPFRIRVCPREDILALFPQHRLVFSQLGPNATSPRRRLSAKTFPILAMHFFGQVSQFLPLVL